MKKTHHIEITQGLYGPIIDKFTIELDDTLDADEAHTIIKEEMHRRLNDAQSLEHDND